jgi:hypothetical protein
MHDRTRVSADDYFASVVVATWLGNLTNEEESDGGDS